MPIGFSKSTTGEYAGGIFWIVGTAVLFSWVVSGIITPYLAVNMLPKDFGKHHHGGDPYDTPFYRKLRGWIDLAIERRWWVIGATVARTGRRDRRDASSCRSSSSRNSSRPELVVELRLKEGASFAATTEQVKKMEAVLEEGRGRPLLHRVHGRRPAALLSLAQSGAAEPGLRRLHRHDDATWRRVNACARA